MLTYTKKSNYNYLSYGKDKSKGKFKNKPETVYTYIIENKSLSKFCLVERKTKISKYYWDIDLKDDFLKDLNVIEIGDYIVDIINTVTKEYIFESNYLYLDKNEGYGIHLIYPDILIDKANILYLRNKVLDVMCDDKKYGLTREQWKKIIDESVYNTGLRMLYQKIDGKYYQLNESKSTYENIPDDGVKILELASIRSLAKEINFPSLIKENNKVVKQYDKKEQLVIINKDNEVLTPYLKKIINEDMTLIPKIKSLLLTGMNLLNVDNICTRSDWIAIGILCYQFGNYGINLWIEFSKKSAEFNMDGINRILKTFYYKDNGYTLKSLLYYVNKCNNIDVYNKFITEHKEIIDLLSGKDDDINIEYLDKMFDLGDEGLIKLYCNNFKDILVCSDIVSNEFYMYDEKTKLWILTNFKNIQNHFMENMKIIIRPLINYYKNKSNNCKDLNNAKIFDKKADNIKYCSSYYKASTSKPLIPLIAAKLYDNKFLNKLNSNPILLPVKGGVLNLRTGECRSRYSNDLFSFELDVEWKGLDYETNNIDKFMNDIMLDDVQMVNYLQCLLGYSISGLIREQLFIILWGSGGNGKGVLMNLLSKLMGEYYTQLKNDLILKTNNNNTGATPHLMELLGSRLAFADESDMDSKLNEALIKNITGGGLITARKLYSSPVTFKPTFQLFLLTNHKPEINCSDSIKRRLILIPFLAEFKNKDRYDKNNKKHKLGDTEIEEKLEKYLDEFLVWLVKGSIKYFEHGLDKLPKKD